MSLHYVPLAYKSKCILYNYLRLLLNMCWLDMETEQIRWESQQLSWETAMSSRLWLINSYSLKCMQLFHIWSVGLQTIWFWLYLDCLDDVRLADLAAKSNPPGFYAVEFSCAPSCRFFAFFPPCLITHLSQVVRKCRFGLFQSVSCDTNYIDYL